LLRKIGHASVGHLPLWDETDLGETKEDALVNGRAVNSLCRTAVYVTRTYGGVGGGVP
jgi:hypothetical protein